MKKGLTELVFILDRSGSMTGLESDTIGGFNSMIRKQKKEGVLVTTVLFDNVFETIHKRVPIEKIEEMTEEEYYTRGSTALLDAMGSTIGDVRKKQKRQMVCERPEKTIFVIITDGQENSSRSYDYDDIRELVEKQRNLGWEFLFLGANIDAFAEGQRLGIRRERSCKIVADYEGTRRAYEDVGNFIVQAEECECMEDIDEEWCASSEEYYLSKE